MNKKGFTLIELVGVIIIMGLLSSMIIPSVIKIVRDARTDAYDEQISFIEKAAQKWAVYNVDRLSEVRSYYLPTNELLSEGYLTGEDVKDPRKDNRKINGCIVISYDSGHSQYDYSYYDSTCSSLGSNIVETAASCFTVSGATITNYTCTERNITIPKKINGRTITTIGNGAFKKKDLTFVEIQSGITTIGNNAFEENRIQQVTIPDTVTSIGNYAFNENRIAKVFLSENIATLGSFAFANNNITQFSLSSKLNRVNEGTFMNNRITSVELGSNVTVIGNNAFKGNRITAVTMPGIKTIGNSAFMDNELGSISIPSTLTSLGSSAFAKNNINEIIVPSTMTTFDCGVFANNGTSLLSFQSGSTTITNVPLCTNENYNISNVYVPTGTTAHYSAFDGNGSDAKLNDWFIFEQ